MNPKVHDEYDSEANSPERSGSRRRRSRLQHQSKGKNVIENPQKMLRIKNGHLVIRF